MSALKRRTHERHRALEEQIALLRALASLDSYRRLLQTFLAIYRALEPQLMNTPGLHAWLLDLQQRRRIPDLIDDLHTLHSLPNEEPAAGAEQIRNVPDAMGCLYVLEGSTLGGQIIARQVAERLRLTPDHGCRFFSGGGRNAGALWRTFSLSIEAFAAAQPECREQIAMSALTTFETFRMTFAAWAALESPAVQLTRARRGHHCEGM